MTMDDIARWKEMADLTFELADTVYSLFDAIIDFCKKNNIPIQEQEGLWNLTRKTKAIFSEIEQLSSPCYKRPSDEFLQGKKSDKDFTKPRFIRLLYLMTCGNVCLYPKPRCSNGT